MSSSINSSNPINSVPDPSVFIPGQRTTFKDLPTDMVKLILFDSPDISNPNLRLVSKSWKKLDNEDNEIAKSYNTRAFEDLVRQLLHGRDGKKRRKV